MRQRTGGSLEQKRAEGESPERMKMQQQQSRGISLDDPNGDEVAVLFSVVRRDLRECESFAHFLVRCGAKRSRRVRRLSLHRVRPRSFPSQPDLL